jgi:hypothetical protein
MKSAKIPTINIARAVRVLPAWRRKSHAIKNLLIACVADELREDSARDQSTSALFSNSHSH